MPDQFTLLLEWRRNEAAVRGLAKLPHDFYATTQAYLADVRRSYEADLRENPSGRKGEISRQTYQRASQVARDIVEGRVQKLLTAAFQASIGGARDVPNALPEERAMFDQVLRILLEHRRTAAPYIEPTSAVPPGTAVHPASAPRPSEAPPTPAPPPAPPLTTAAPPPARPARATPALTYVRIVKDGRPIEVGSETIDLRADDIVSLPPETAKLLIDAQIAEPVTPASPRPVT
jgi:DNA replication initiation complex subunit (GINS family)